MMNKQNGQVVDIIEGASPWREVWKRFRRNRVAVLSALFISVVVMMAVIGPWLVYQYNGFTYEKQNLNNCLSGISLKHPLGTDILGRDLLARL